MERIRLGTTEMRVTKIGFGGIPLQRLCIEDAVDLIAYAFARGINWVDTGHSYGFSEEAVGQALARFERKDVFVFTKAAAVSFDEVKRLVELSFERLRVEYIDLYQFHQVKSPEHWQSFIDQGGYEYFTQLKSDGRVRHIGASAHSLEAALAVLDDPLVEVLQFPFSFLVEEDAAEILAKCREKDVGFIAMKPMGGGAITDGRLAVRFLKQFPDIAADPGFEKRAEIDEMVACVQNSRLPDEGDLERIRMIRRELGKTFCHRCGYCRPCPQGVSCDSLMVLDTMIKRFPPEKLFGGFVLAAVESLASCTECGVCETRCPYELPLRSRMRENFATWSRLRETSRGAQIN